MTLCRFEFDFRCESSSLVGVIKARVVGVGGAFAGSSAEGSFSLPTPIGDFEGLYRIEGQVITVEVLEKPLLIPCSAIESRLRHYVEGGT